MRFVLLTLLLAGLTFGQVTPQQADELQFFHATQSLTLSAAGTVFTLQVPTKTSKRVYPRAVVLECSVDCTVSQDRNGSAGTGTAVTAVSLNSDATPAAAFLTSSTAGTGAALVPLTVKAGVQVTVDMSYTVFARGLSTVQNHNWRVSSITGTVRATVIWAEK